MTTQNEFDDNQLDDFGQNIPVDDVNRIALSATRSRLFIDCADLTDEATYTCVAENAYTRISSHTKLNLIRPAVQIAPVGGIGDDNDLSVAGNGGGVVGSGSSYNDVNTLSESTGAANLGGALKSLDGGEQTQSRRQYLQQAAAAAAAVAAAPTAAGPAGADNLALSAVPQCLSDRLNGRPSPQVPVRIHMWTHNIVEIMKNNVIIYCRSNMRAQTAQQEYQQQLRDFSSGKQLLLDPTEASSSMSSKALTTPTSSDNNNNNYDSNSNSKTNKRSLVSWTLPDDKLVSDDQKDKYEILETGDLLIKDLRWSDMGSYVCTVSNEHSSDSVSSFVYPASVKVSSKRSAAAVAAAAAGATSRSLSIR